MIISATTLIGDKVKNYAGEDLGKIEELMVDTSEGNVHYAVVSYGGFLGMGDKLFAVPLEAITIDTEEKCAKINVAKERLENAPGFDKDNWPSHADMSWYNDVRTFYQPQ